MSFMDWIADPEAWIALLTLTALEIVLGIDNIIFITILAGKLSPAPQPRAPQWGVMGAMFTRIPRRGVQDLAVGFRVLVGFGAPRGGHGPPAAGDGGGDCHRGGHHAVRFQTDRRFCAPPPDDQNPGAELPAANRPVAG